VAIGTWGAANAAILAAQIIAVGDPSTGERLAAYRKRLADEVEERAQRVADRMKARG
jgi:phosphoribosylcarboxyaminoimidazole (NCAIR) mutase